MSNKVLCVDDDANVLAGIQRNLRKQFDIATAVGSLAALKMLESHGPFAVLVADMQMPGLNGVELLNIARKKCPDTIRVMLTGNADQKTATDAVNKGHVFQFLNKPCSPDKLAEVLHDGIQQYRRVAAERELLENTLNGSVEILLEILSLEDPASFGRSQTVRDYARQVARTLQMASPWELELAAMLAPIGCVSVPPGLHFKARSGFGLTGPEKDILQRIPQVGCDLLAHIPRLQSVARIVLYQAKHFDGSGFPPDSIKGDEIPMESRILMALSELVRLEAKRLPKFKALEQMQRQPGWYDPVVLEALAGSFDLTAQPAVPQESSVAVSFAALHVGHLLLSDVKTNDGVLIVMAGTKVSPLLMERLRNFARLSVLVEPIYVQDGGGV